MSITASSSVPTNTSLDKDEQGNEKQVQATASAPEHRLETEEPSSDDDISSVGTDECEECQQGDEDGGGGEEPKENNNEEEDFELESEDEDEVNFIGPNTVQEDLFGHQRFMTGYLKAPRRVRWFCLNDVDLTAYKESQKDRTKDLYLSNFKFHIYLSDIEKVITDLPEGQFKIKTFQKEYTLKARNAVKKTQWIRAIELAVNINRSNEDADIATLSLENWIWKDRKRYWWRLAKDKILFFNSKDPWEEPAGELEIKHIKRVVAGKTKNKFGIEYLKGKKTKKYKLRTDSAGHCRKWLTCLKRLQSEYLASVGGSPPPVEEDFSSQKKKKATAKDIFRIDEKAETAEKISVENLDTLQAQYSPPEGWLVKLGQRRWCKIENFALNYYFDNGSWADRMGSINLGRVLDLTISESEFAIRTKKKTYHFQAENPDQHEPWVNALKMGMLIAHRLKVLEKKSNDEKEAANAENQMQSFVLGKDNLEDEKVPLSELLALARPKQGWLSKIVGLGGHVRWFKLDDAYLHYFDGDGAWSEGLGSISLAQIKEIHERNGFGIDLVVKGRVYHLAAENQETLHEWLQALWIQTRIAHKKVQLEEKDRQFDKPEEKKNSFFKRFSKDSGSTQARTKKPEKNVIKTVEAKDFTPILWTSWVSFKGDEGLSRVWMVLNGTKLELYSGKDAWSEVVEEIPLGELTEVGRSGDKLSRIYLISGKKKRWTIDTEVLEDRDQVVKHLRASARFVKANPGQEVLAVPLISETVVEEENPIDTKKLMEEVQHSGLEAWMAIQKLTSFAPSAEKFFVLRDGQLSMHSGNDSWAEELLAIPLDRIKRVEPYGSNGIKVESKKHTLRLIPRLVEDKARWLKALSLLTAPAKSDEAPGSPESQATATSRSPSSQANAPMPSGNSDKHSDDLDGEISTSSKAQSAGEDGDRETESVLKVVLADNSDQIAEVREGEPVHHS